MAKTSNSIPEMKIDDRLTSIEIPDLSGIPLMELVAMYDAAELMDAATLGIVNQPRVQDSAPILDYYGSFTHMLQSAIYNEARKRTPANEEEAEARGKVLVERLLDWEKPWSAIAAVAAEVSAWRDASTTEPAEKSAEPEHASVPWDKLLCREWTQEQGEAIYGKEHYAGIRAKQAARAEAMKERAAVPLHERWSELFAEWLTLEAAWATTDGDSDVPDEVGDRIQEQEAALVQRMIVAKPRLGYEVAQKLTVLEKYMSSDEWADRRDWLLLGSLKRDVAALS